MPTLPKLTYPKPCSKAIKIADFYTRSQISFFHQQVKSSDRFIFSLVVQISNFVEIFSYEDVKVYFHRREQFLDLSGRMGYKIYKGETMQSQVSWHDVR